MNGRDYYTPRKFTLSTKEIRRCYVCNGVYYISRNCLSLSLYQLLNLKFNLNISNTGASAGVRALQLFLEEMIDGVRVFDAIEDTGSAFRCCVLRCRHNF